MQNKQNFDTNKLKNILNKLKLNESTAQEPNMEQTVQKVLSPEQQKLFHSVMSDEKKKQEILNSPQAQKLIDMLFKEK